MQHITFIQCSLGDYDTTVPPANIARQLMQCPDVELCYHVLTPDTTLNERARIVAARDSEEDLLIVYGHGTPDGLFAAKGAVDLHGSPTQLMGGIEYFVNGDIYRRLSARRFIGIWCYAATWAKYNRASGFFSDMFISNADEADYVGISGVSDEDINAVGINFCTDLGRLLGQGVSLPDLPAHFHRDRYANAVEAFNYRRLTYLG